MCFTQVGSGDTQNIRLGWKVLPWIKHSSLKRQSQTLRLVFKIRYPPVGQALAGLSLILWVRPGTDHIVEHLKGASLR
jgi:hypothetical protein